MRYLYVLLALYKNARIGGHGRVTAFRLALSWPKSDVASLGDS
jgi:hypothetical protein